MLWETHIAHQALEEDKLGLELLYPERQLILAHLALLQVLWASMVGITEGTMNYEPKTQMNLKFLKKKLNSLNWIERNTTLAMRCLVKGGRLP